MDFKDISPELGEKAKACASPEELLELAREEGYELSDEELEGISGGGWGEDCFPDCQTIGDYCRRDDDAF